MPRGSEIVRLLTILKHLDAGRTNTIPKLAAELGCVERTIRRDLDALQNAGFPIYDERINGTTFWRLDGKVFKGLERTSLTFSELCALYASRALLERFAGSLLVADLHSAFTKFEAAFTPKMKKLLDQMPQAIRAKGSPTRAGEEAHTTTSRLLEAIVDHQVIGMRYHSHASRRDKDYVVHPYRIVFAQGGLYLMAFVPAYSQVRAFAIERIRKLIPTKETFRPIAELEGEPFGDSLGVHQGKPVKVQLRFRPEIADTIRERAWHPSQQLKDRSDGSVVMSLQVSDDYALRAWILGFGHLVRVLGPASLVEWAQEELAAARDQYDGSTTRLTDGEGQPALPFLFNQIARA
jgi:predicted DNA-binding transcriptional regulator YafY